MAQWVKHLTWAQVMILRSVSSSPASGFVLTARSLEPASDSVSVSVYVSLSLSLSLHLPPLTLCLSLSQKYINIKKKKKDIELTCKVILISGV